LDAVWFDRNRLRLFRPILLEGHSIGTIYLESDLEDVNLRLKQSAIALLAILLGASTFAFIVTAKLKATITEPIRHLAQAAQYIESVRYVPGHSGALARRCHQRKHKCTILFD
jgi:hypothetical protein